MVCSPRRCRLCKTKVAAAAAAAPAAAAAAAADAAAAVAAAAAAATDLPGARTRPCSKTPHLPTFATSSPLGSAGALETAARARSAPLGRSKWPLELARLRQGARNCSTWLLENTASADVSEVEPARLRWVARHRSSSPLGSAGPETLHWAGPRMPASLNRETNILVHGMHGHTQVYISAGPP